MTTKRPRVPRTTAPKKTATVRAKPAKAAKGPKVGLLVSVRSAAEAKLALAAGADLIDVKEPSKGPLGMAEAEIVAEVIGVVKGKVPVSAALGDWSENALTEAVWHLEQPLNYVKWGLAGYQDRPGWGDDLLETRRQIPARTEVVAVAYADWAKAKSIPPDVVAKFARRYRYRAFLLDTFLKDAKTLLDHLKPDAISAIIGPLKEAGIAVALGGGIRFEQLKTLKELGPNWIAVRGGVCAGGSRKGELDPVRIKKWKAALS